VYIKYPIKTTRRAAQRGKIGGDMELDFGNEPIVVRDVFLSF
jgi:hypothetical protein